MELSGAGRRIDLVGSDPKIIDHVVTLKSIKGQSLEYNIAAAMGLELHHPIMSKLWEFGDHTYRQTDESAYIIRRKQKRLLEIQHKGRMHLCRDILMGHQKYKTKKDSIIVLRNGIHPHHIIYFGVSLLI